MITVLGATGFIGSSIVKKLKEQNVPYFAPGRNELITKVDLGDIIYCIGLTADFRTKPFEAVDAHICKLNQVLSQCTFNSLTYLSSSRVYINSTNQVAFEEDKILVDPLNFEDLYTLTKLTGERLCLSSGKTARVARLSNVVGKQDSANFLTAVIDSIENESSVVLHQQLSSSKDYIFIDDVVDLLLEISVSGTESIYNVASGFNTSIQQIMDALSEYFDFSYSVNEGAGEVVFPVISNKKVCNEFSLIPKPFSENLKNMMK